MRFWHLVGSAGAGGIDQRDRWCYPMAQVVPVVGAGGKIVPPPVPLQRVYGRFAVLAVPLKRHLRHA